MGGWFRLVGPERAIEVFGIRLVGLNAETGKKLLISLAFIAAVYVVSRLLRVLASAVFTGPRGDTRPAFWTRQAIMVLNAAVLVVGLVSIWFDDPGRMATAFGLVAAGLAFALQRVVTAFAGYVLILRGNTFSVGDRITMGGVRGDVMRLGFLQTTIMEMGQPPSVNQQADPAMWVKSRQYTGRIVSVSNAKIFDEPVYNYTREFPYIWEEMTVPVSYKDDWRRAEALLLETATRHTTRVAQLGEPELRELERRYATHRSRLAPRVYMRLTDNWIELTVRFIVPDHGVRDIKDAIARDLLTGLAAAGIGIASATSAIVELPTVRVEVEPRGSSGGRGLGDDGRERVREHTAGRKAERPPE